MRRAADAEKATCALLEQHAREAAVLGVHISTMWPLFAWRDG